MPLGTTLEKNTQLKHGFFYVRRTGRDPKASGMREQIFQHIVGRSQGGRKKTYQVVYRKIGSTPSDFTVSIKPVGLPNWMRRAVLHDLSTRLGLEHVEEAVYRKPGATPTKPPETSKPTQEREETEKTPVKDRAPKSMNRHEFIRLVEQLGYKPTKRGYAHPSGHAFTVNPVGEIRDPNLLARIWKMRKQN